MTDLVIEDDDEWTRKRRKEEGKRNKRQRIQESGGIRPRSSGNSNKNSNNNNKHGGDHNRNDNSSSNNNNKSDPNQKKKSSEEQPWNGNNGDAVVMSPSQRKSIENRPHQRPSWNDQNRDRPQSSGYHKNNNSSSNNKPSSTSSYLSKHRFGRVMERVPCRNKPRYSTLSIALPSSVLANCQTRELRTILVGQIARAATIYHVDEIVIFDDKLGTNNAHNYNDGDGNHRTGSWRDFRRQKSTNHQQHDTDDKNNNTDEKDDDRQKGASTDSDDATTPTGLSRPRSSDPSEFMCRLLQYCECPQYLRRNFFPMHPDLQFAGLLAPIDAPHHVRAEDHSKYREGIVLNKCSPSGLSLVNCGIRSRPVEIDRKLTPGIRCTVQIDIAAYGRPGLIKGIVVSPSAPREDDGTYWGYTTRMATSIHDVFAGCPYNDDDNDEDDDDGPTSGGRGYDLKIGTSERGDTSVEERTFTLPKYEHSLIVFGGVAGIEECVDADESIKLPGNQSKKLFDVWLNTCPYQGSRTIRTEEAVMISLATLSPLLVQSARNKEKVIQKTEPAPDVEFSDASPSEESSSEDSASESDGGSEDDSNDDDQ